MKFKSVDNTDGGQKVVTRPCLCDKEHVTCRHDSECLECGAAERERCTDDCSIGA